ncbi:cold-shock protein [Ralstonia pseudosolanacearum]|uniref:cold-shock protein n=1 Tax=Ralstonia pseudosolanacearum TaxID=1310165 RepID=UPI00267638B0|nr:cold shock domain-containing protein [Ralstonia pseudosolanacearum]MDO3522534.1 cold shock domain-containing protein [Ralstonia pseudosolanacearum]MDO3546270.1 cold shock domain-containing protein [Ralstonia pseudosolanacearum]MDO3551759.1 cold shock domain-containing protein [Ralstonia pseudosolanacearum]MDO3565624.1 cold shock domain-containing protein [Ralstonia pseudosolanacearum]MDO3580147.1 cold shock domain-containing protein [Ralstonia pseudosolanacearum]
MTCNDSPDTGGNDLFAHFSEIQGNRVKSLQEGQKVHYVVGVGQNGPTATKIEPV